MAGSATFPPDTLRWILGFAFIIMGAWVLIPDKLDEPSALKNSPTTKTAWAVFIITVTTFFFAEIGDKTQIATIGLAARYDPLVAVIAGSTLGLLIADAPVVWLGHKTSGQLPLKLIHGIAALFFIAIGAWILYFGI